MDIREKIKNGLFYFDGATGSELQKMGIQPGELPETWNITNRDKIITLGKNYFEAGANAVSANTFGANLMKYDGKSGNFSLDEIVKAAMECAFEAKTKASGDLVQSDKYVGLDVGPLGKLLKPFGNLDFEDAVNYFKETIGLGVKYGAEYILIETMNDLLETKAAVIAARESTDIPVFVSNVFDETHKTMTGSGPKVTTTMLNSMRIDAMGANCSLGPDKMLEIVPELYENSKYPVIFMPNAGMPEIIDGKTCYSVDADTFGDYAAEAVKKGARMLGGCCGTTPEHIRQTVLKTRDLKPLPIRYEQSARICSYSKVVSFSDIPVLIGERINPTGKKKLKEALRAEDMSYILNEAIREEEAGADVLDVNVGLPEINEPYMLKKTVSELQAVTALPLQLDSSDPESLKAAMRIYNGKAMINSVNGKKEVMDKVFPLVKKYGGYVVCLTLDENGIPDTAEGRYEIAKKIVDYAANYGIDKNDLIFDPLTLTVSSDTNAGKVTLDSIRLIKEKLNAKVSLGVSNVSFGLPKREMITSTFFVMALGAGLDAAIMNPFSFEMMKAYRCFLTLNGKDENCLGYIGFAADAPDYQSIPAIGADANKSSLNENKCGKATGSGHETVTADKDASTGNPFDTLIKAIKRGLSDNAGTETRKLSDTYDAMDIINKGIVAALNEVGDGFEKKTVYLPELLMSAEAAKSAFAVISELMPESTEKGPKVIMATVKGDIHDIGKNIVVALLKNYGFDVRDLGKDVDPEVITEYALRENIKFVGLSALMTTTVPAMEETIKELKACDPEIKVCVGGAVLTPEYAKMINADFYAANAMETVRFAQKTLLGEK